MKAQAAIEFSFTLMFALLFFGIIMIIVIFHTQRYNAENLQKTVTHQAQMLQRELVTAASVEPGYWRDINVPSELQGRPYTLQTFSTSLVITADTAVSTVQIPNTTGSFTTGPNRIRNVNGTVVIE